MIDKIMAYEQDELDYQETLLLFSELLCSGLCWKLQGHYGRTARDLIEAGYLDARGAILKDIDDEQ